MDFKVKAQWVNALRSGEYKQGRLALRTDDTYCCLGVLCDLYNKEHGDNLWKDSESNDGIYSMEGECTVPPSCVWDEWAHLQEPNPVYSSYVLTPSLAETNDKGASFEEIADIIEKYL